MSTKEYMDYIKRLLSCDNVNLEYLSQYAKEQFDDVPQRQIGENDVINLILVGNIGKDYSLESIIRAATLLKLMIDLNFT